MSSQSFNFAFTSEFLFCPYGRKLKKCTIQGVFLVEKFDISEYGIRFRLNLQKLLEVKDFEAFYMLV